MGKPLEGRVAIVTGGGGALGRSHSLTLSSLGAKVVVNDLGGSLKGEGADKTSAQKVVDEIKGKGGEAVANYDTISTADGAAAVVKSAIDAFGKIDIVINNAGFLRDVSFTKMTDDDWLSIIGVHLTGAYYVTKAAWPRMKDQNYGRVIMTASAAGIYGNFGQANYSAAKMGLIGFGQTLAHEGKKNNINVNIIAPIARSRLTETVMPAPMLENLKPEFVSPLVAYLCSEESKETGGTFEVGGGYFTKIAWYRSPGVGLKVTEPINYDTIKENFPKIVDFTNAKICRTIQESTMAVMSNLSKK